MTTTNHSLTLHRFKQRRTQRRRLRPVRPTLVGQPTQTAFASPSEQALRDIPTIHSLHR